jgi:hypothetical protein
MRLINNVWIFNGSILGQIQRFPSALAGRV